MKESKRRSPAWLIWPLAAIGLMLNLCACKVDLAGTAGSPTEQPLTWQEQYDLGMRYLSEGNYEEAILMFTAAIEIDPKQAPAYVGRGDAHTGAAQLSMAGMGDGAELTQQAAAGYQNAVADYLAAIELDAFIPSVYQKAAETYVLLGDSEAAAAILERGVEATGDQELQKYLDELRMSMDYVIQWQDPAFERMVRMAIGKPEGEIFRSELDQVKDLKILGDQYASIVLDNEWGYRYCSYDPNASEGVLLAFYGIGDTTYTERGSISSIEDIVHFRNLESLYMVANHVSDLTPLLSLKQLRTVHVWGNEIADLSVLDQLELLPDLYSDQLNSEQFVEIGDALPIYKSQN